MARSGRGAAPRDIRALFHVGATGGLSDEQLLEWFVARDREAAELAFAELVTHHGPMVLHVCRTILRDADGADDAFQATFLILARRAGSIRKRASTASWLHGVARRVATSARLAAVRRRVHDRRADTRCRCDPGDDAARDDLAELLHQELQVDSRSDTERPSSCATWRALPRARRRSGSAGRSVRCAAGCCGVGSDCGAG